LPPSDVHEPVQTLETTWSHAVETGVAAWRTRALNARWRLIVQGDAVPLLRSRLSIRLPTKYPGQILRSDSFGFGARGRIAIERHGGRVGVGGALTLNGARGYWHKARYSDRGVGADLFLSIER
jgi:hypothetical protein